MPISKRVTLFAFLILTRCLQAIVTSEYTGVLQKTLEHWPPPAVVVSELEGKAVQLRIFETPGNRNYIGTELEMKIGASLSAVETILDDVDHYVELLPGFAEIKKTGIDATQFDVYWEKTIPVFFIKNIKYTIRYSVDRTKPDRRVYRGQLKEDKGLKALDSLLVIEKKGAKTHYYECAFFDGDFGVISSLAPMKIWRESIEAVLHGALAKKMKAERPELKYEQIMNEVSSEVKAYPVETLVTRKKPHPELQ